MDTQELGFRLELICKLKEERAELDSQITALEDSVKNELDRQGVSDLEVGKRSVKYTRYFSNRFDNAAFKADHEDLYVTYSKPVPATRFTVK